MAPFKDLFRWESKQGANFEATVGEAYSEKRSCKPVEGCSHANPFHRVADGGCIQWDFVCSDTTKYHICCGHQRHVVQCIELLLQVPRVGFCAGEHSMQST